MRRGAILAIVVAVSVAAGACAPAAPAHEGDDEALTCEAGFSTPPGFHATESLEDPYADHVGIRLGFADDDGRELHYFAGIPGEFGEGLPAAGTVAAGIGVGAVLQGSETTWVLSWRTPGPCGVRAVLGSGFGKEEFLGTLERAGIVPAQ